MEESSRKILRQHPLFPVTWLRLLYRSTWIPKIALVILLGFGGAFFYNWIRMYRLLKARHKKVMSYNGHPVTLRQYRNVPDEEYEKLLKAMESKITDDKCGLLSLAGPGVLKVFPESCSFLAGPSAVLLQIGHPYVANAIMDHSEVRKNIRMRYQKTFYYVFRIAFGDLKECLNSSKIVRRLHNRAVGTIRSSVGPYKAGEPYAASDADALIWVFYTLQEGAVFMRELFFGKLKEQDYQDIINGLHDTAQVWGIDPSNLPKDYKSFEEHYFSIVNSDMISVSPEAKEIASFLMKPILWEKHLPVYNSILTIASVLLPAPVSKQYGFKVGIFEVMYTAALLGLLRMVYVFLPRDARCFTSYLRNKYRREGKQLPYVSQKVASVANTFMDLALSHSD